MIKKKLSGKNLEALPIKEVYFTDDYYKKISKKKTKEGGSYLDLVLAGRGVRGFKHLLECLYKADGKNKIIFTNGETCKKDDEWNVNLEEYKKAVNSKFLSFYRETGLDGALNYLSQKMPKEFSYKKDVFSEKECKKAIENLPEVLTNLKKQEDKTVVIDELSAIVKDLGDKKQKNKVEKKNIENIKKSSNIAAIKSGLDEFHERINGDKRYKETSGKDHWQGWLKANSWIFGVFYDMPYEKMKIGFDNIPDFLFPTLDGFVDIYEIKLPEHKVVVRDSSHKGSFMWSSEANKAIGQCVNYLHEIEINQLALKEKVKNEYGIEIDFIKPRAFVVIGSDEVLSTLAEQKAFKMLNYSLHGIEVITYSDLARRGEQMLKIYGQ